MLLLFACKINPHTKLCAIMPPMLNSKNFANNNDNNDDQRIVGRSFAG
jgi:hypothetical protein